MKKFYLSAILIALILTIGLKPTSSANENDIILTWSSSSFAPVWYPGKRLPSSGSQIIISASPEMLLRGTNLKSQDLIYRWFLDYRFQKTASGQGQQDFSFTASGSKGTPINIKVEIQKPNGVFLGQKSLKITLAEPTVQIHRLLDNRTLGPVFKATTDLKAGQKIDLIAAPFFFNANDISQFIFRWSANNQSATAGSARPDILHLNIGSEIPAGTIYDLQATIKNNTKENETSSHFLRINIK